MEGPVKVVAGFPPEVALLLRAALTVRPTSPIVVGVA
jgi:hypothetical protein